MAGIVMNKQSWLLNLSLLKTHRRFAQYSSLVLSQLCLWVCSRRGAGADPDDDAFYLAGGALVTLTGGAMFVGLMVGGVLAVAMNAKK